MVEAVALSVPRFHAPFQTKGLAFLPRQSALPRADRDCGSCWVTADLKYSSPIATDLGCRVRPVRYPPRGSGVHELVAKHRSKTRKLRTLVSALYLFHGAQSAHSPCESVDSEQKYNTYIENVVLQADVSDVSNHIPEGECLLAHVVILVLVPVVHSRRNHKVCHTGNHCTARRGAVKKPIGHEHCC